MAHRQLDDEGHWGNLTNDQLDSIAGKRTELAGEIQESYGIGKDEVESQIKAFEKNYKDDVLGMELTGQPVWKKAIILIFHHLVALAGALLESETI